jgi:multidrug efflux pump subunit AcrB
VPLVLSSGAGAQMRQAMGVAVFFAMLGFTFSACVSHQCSTCFCVSSKDV